jgi:transposase
MSVGVKQVLLRSKGYQKGERLPPGAPCGVVYGQVSSLRSVDLPTASRLRRADTPIRKEEIPKRKPITIAVLSRAHPPSYGSTYLSGKAVQTNRATSHDGIGIWLAARRLHQGKFAWASDCDTHCQLERVQLDALVLGLPWQRMGQAGVITVV